jgi:hypothetical protein
MFDASPTSGSPSDPADEDTNMLSEDAGKLIDLIGATNLEFASMWLPAIDVRMAAIEHGLWPGEVESVIDQRITEAMAELGLTKDNGGKKRLPVNDKKTTCYNAKMLRDALHRYRK